MPKARTLDPSQETVSSSQDAIIPMTYGHVDKAPMVYSKAIGDSNISRVLPDDVLGSDSVRIYGYANDDALLLLRGDD